MGIPAPTVIADRCRFLEAPRWHRGDLYLSDFYRRMVYRAPGGDGPLEALFEVPGQPSGLGFLPDGDLLVSSMLDRRVMRWNGEVLALHADLSGMLRFPINDMVVDAIGRAYVGGFGWDTHASDEVVPTALALVEPDGAARLVADDLIFPNGMALTPDGRLLVAETFAHRVSAFAVAPDGSLADRATWAAFGAPSLTIAASIEARRPLPDGIALDAEGALWIADAAGHGIARVAEGGRQLDYIDTGNLAAFAAALGGADGRQLFLCAAPPLPHDPRNDEAAVLLACRVPIAGAAWG